MNKKETLPQEQFDRLNEEKDRLEIEIRTVPVLEPQFIDEAEGEEPLLFTRKIIP